MNRRHAGDQIQDNPVALWATAVLALKGDNIMLGNEKTQDNLQKFYV